VGLTVYVLDTLMCLDSSTDSKKVSTQENYPEEYKVGSNKYIIAAEAHSAVHSYDAHTFFYSCL
jgi:hypothetical protein